MKMETKKMSQSEYLEVLNAKINKYDVQFCLENKLIAELEGGDEIKRAKARLRQLRMVDFLRIQYQHIKYNTPEALSFHIKGHNDLNLAEYGLSQEKSVLKILSFSTDDEFLVYLISRS
jgi:hypothetical protein